MHKPMPIARRGLGSGRDVTTDARLLPPSCQSFLSFFCLFEKRERESRVFPFVFLPLLLLPLSEVQRFGLLLLPVPSIDCPFFLESAPIGLCRTRKKTPPILSPIGFILFWFGVFLEKKKSVWHPKSASVCAFCVFGNLKAAGPTE
nr:hypothetical protein [Pandoravirus massiliensis]